MSSASIGVPAGIPAKPANRGVLRQMRKQWSAYLFLAPTMILFGIFTVAAVVYAFYLSFHQWNILEPAKPFVGLDNYSRLLADERVRGAIANTLYYTAVSVPLTMGLGLLIALLLNNQIRARGFFRTLFYLPVVTPLVIAAIIWKWVYNGDFGLLNYYLIQFGIIHEPLLWLSDPNLAMPSVIITSVWKSVGFSMVVYLAGLQSIPEDFYDAAKVDGADGAAAPEGHHHPAPLLDHPIPGHYLRARSVSGLHGNLHHDQRWSPATNDDDRLSHLSDGLQELRHGLRLGDGLWLVRDDVRVHPGPAPGHARRGGVLR